MPFSVLAFAVALMWTDLPPALRRGDEATFAAMLEGINLETGRRVEEGEWDHLVYYLLQGTAFTARPVIEPAVSARQFVESGTTPLEVAGRLEDLARSAGDSFRLKWARGKIEGVPREQVINEYRRAMRFLYDKEWATRKMSGPQRRAQVAKLYQTRGHSSDTNPDSTKAVESGLAVLREEDPKAELRDVLVIGPGSDFAPRTALRESAGPGSYQMDLLRESLPKAAVECIDVNPRVVETVGCAERINILTARRERRYDLIVMTNVLVYFSDLELPLALANVRAMLKLGGYLLHNELRDEVEPVAKALGLPVVHARTVRLGGSAERPLFDGVVLHKCPK